MFRLFAVTLVYGSGSICVELNVLDPIFKARTCLNKASELIVQVRPQMRSMNSKLLPDELRDSAVTHIWTRLEKKSASLILHKSSVISVNYHMKEVWANQDSHLKKPDSWGRRVLARETTKNMTEVHRSCATMEKVSTTAAALHHN